MCIRDRQSTGEQTMPCQVTTLRVMYLCMILEDVLFCGLMVAIFITEATQTTIMLAAHGGVVANVDTSCSFQSTEPCYGVYSCVEQLCKQQQAGSYTTFLLPVLPEDCRTDTTFERIWDVKYYRLAIICGISQLTGYAVLLLFLGIEKAGIKISGRLFWHMFVSNKLFVLGWIVGIFGGEYEHAQTGEQAPASIRNPAHWTVVILFIIFVGESIKQFYLFKTHKKISKTTDSDNKATNLKQYFPINI
eukprot:TRINITY_DN5858_c0_g1_i1.p1 TRINITY_DN5858_c0_g1~~TRINITY_DN5858_c0_g1_i1.p1  ORF type:complete len:247 (-),score=18.52 TRINITY_DN5858_c0_g1_i1:46-786(-)